MRPHSGVEEFRLHRSATTRFLTVGVPALMLVAGLVVVVPLGLVKRPPAGPAPIVFLAVWFLVVALAIFQSLRMPTAIELHAQGKVVFRARLRQIEIDARAIRSIRPRGNQFGYLTLRHDGGSVVFLNQFDGFHRFLTRLEELNPSVELVGC